MAFVKAVKEKIKLRIALIGPSGSGKTFSALRLCKGLGGKTALIDTEERRSLYYAPEFNFDVSVLQPPFSPERYITEMVDAEKAEYNNIIIDSASHEWIGAGGILDVLGNMPGTNQYTKWNVLTPRHNAFIDKIVRSKCNIIVCLRGKDEYILTENDKGKKVPQKVGVGAQMRDGIEYECTASFLIDIERHIATTMKDNTHLFENRFEVLTEKDGEALAAWADSGNVRQEPVAKTENAPSVASTVSQPPTISEQQALDIIMEVSKKEAPEFIEKLHKLYVVNDLTNIPATEYQKIMDSIAKKPFKKDGGSNVGSK